MAPYAKPGPLGGKLIRTLIKNLREHQTDITSPILCAVSGGPDSLAMAALLLRYGRKVAAPEKVTLLYIDHGWRPKAAKREKKMVERLANKWGAVFRLESIEWKEVYEPGESAEARARTERKKIFKKLIQETGAKRVWTAHHADDLAETLLWRLFTGTWSMQSGGILWQTELEFRPLLSVRKSDLLGFLKEEKLRPSKDSSNLDPRFLRTRMRKHLLPQVEKLFPRAVEHLAFLAFQEQTRGEGAPPDETVKILEDSLRQFAQSQNLRLKPSHWRQILAQGVDSNWQGEISLPGRWKLIREPK